MRILHVMLRVGDLPRSLKFYQEVLGMRVFRTVDCPEQKYTLVYLGYGDETKDAVLELTYNYGTTHYELGSAYGHIAIEVEDAKAACAAARAQGAKVIRDAGPVVGGEAIIAFLEDPEGYKIELIEAGTLF